MKDEIITGVLGPFLAIDVRIAINCEVSSSNNASFCWATVPESASNSNQ